MDLHELLHALSSLASFGRLLAVHPEVAVLGLFVLGVIALVVHRHRNRTRRRAR